MRFPVLALLLALLASAGQADDSLDRTLDALSSRLAFAPSDGAVRAQFSGTLDLEFHAFEHSPPDLIETDDGWALQPRFTVFLDLQVGPRLYGFAQARVDRGFDPAADDMEARLDEYALRFTPWRDGRLNLQAGQFATILGQWVHRHLSWQNPLITAPLFYERVTPLSDLAPPSSVYGDSYDGGFGYEPVQNAYAYNPVIWGPSYTSGFAASGRWSEWEWSLELKNAAPMSRPEYWSITETQFDHPTVSGRLAWRPDLRWTVGLAASRGAYVGRSAARGLPAGEDRGDYQQSLVLFDLSYAHRHLQVWAEVIHGRFDVPSGQTARMWGYFIEAKYKFSPRFAAALRWNQQIIGDAPEGGNTGRWGETRSRIDLAATWRFNAHSQIQAEVDWEERNSGAGPRGILVATRYTLRF